MLLRRYFDLMRGLKPTGPLVNVRKLQVCYISISLDEHCGESVHAQLKGQLLHKAAASGQAQQFCRCWTWPAACLCRRSCLCIITAAVHSCAVVSASAEGGHCPRSASLAAFGKAPLMNQGEMNDSGMG